jgi:hypothetical protein
LQLGTDAKQSHRDAAQTSLEVASQKCRNCRGCSCAVPPTLIPASPSHGQEPVVGRDDPGPNRIQIHIQKFPHVGGPKGLAGIRLLDLRLIGTPRVKR